MSEVSVTPNEEYLESFIDDADSFDPFVLLPHERVAVDLAVEKQRKAYDDVIDEKIAVTGGDDWHDGAFRATDNQAKIIATRMSAIKPYLHAPTVDYPLETEERVTLGSRIVVSQNGYEFPVDIVGFREGHPEDLSIDGYEDEVLPMSMESPLAKALLGLKEGDETTYQGGGKELTARLILIDQIGIKDYFMADVEVNLIGE